MTPRILPIIGLLLGACAVTHDPDNVASGGAAGASDAGLGGKSGSAGAGAAPAGGSGGSSAGAGGVGATGGTSSGGATGGTGGGPVGGSGGVGATGGVTTGGSAGSGATGGTGGTGGTSTGGTGGTSTGGTGGSSGSVGIGVYNYTAVPAFGIINPAAVAYHPTDGTALVLNWSDTVYRYSAGALTQIASAGSGVSWRDVVYVNSDKAVLLGHHGSLNEGRLYVWDETTSKLTELTAEKFAGGTYESLDIAAGSGKLLAQKPSSGSGYLAYLWDFTLAAGRSNVKAKPTSAGCQDLAWATDAFNGTAVAVVCGLNGASLFHLDSGGFFQDYTGNSGNVSRISSRPQRDYALLVGSSSSRAYRYQQGLWTTGFSSPQLNGIFGVEFSSDGARALLFGRAQGTPLTGRVFEFRHDLMALSDFTDVSIPNFSLPPYNADGNVYLNDVSWTPGCDGGLIVGGINTLTNKKGYVIRFSVINGKVCT